MFRSSPLLVAAERYKPFTNNSAKNIILKKRIIINFLPILFFFFISCKKDFGIPENSKIFAKHIVFDSATTARVIDTNDAEEFTKRKECHFEFKLDNKIYSSEFSLILYPDGTLHELYRYWYQKPEMYGKNGLDTISIDGSKVSIKFSKEHNQIIDEKDTLDIEKVYEKEKLILTRQQQHKNRIIFYEYKVSFNSKDVYKETPDFKK